MADPDWRGGRYLVEGTRPAKGLAVARMAAHITYLSESALHRRFGRNLQDRSARTFSFDADFQVESYLRHQGSIFVERFDPNSYLYMTRAMDYFDLAADYGGSLANAFKGSRTRFCVVSFTSDWLFPTRDSRAIVRALNAGGASVSFVEIETDRGHDAFLLDVPDLHRHHAGLHRRRGAGERHCLSLARTLAPPARRPFARGRTGRARLAGSRCRLRRRRAAAASGRRAKCRRTRNRAFAAGRQRLRGEGALRHSGRRRRRPRRLSRTTPSTM